MFLRQVIMNRLLIRLIFIAGFFIAYGYAQAQIDTIWTRTYGGDHHDYATSLLQTVDGGYLMTGVTYSYGAGDKDFYLVRTDLNGDTLWTKTYGDTLIDNVFSIKPTFDGGYVIGGWSSSRSGTNHDFDCYIVKIDRAGFLEWENYCTDSSNCGAYDIVQADDGGYLLAGCAKSSNVPSNFDLFVVRADQSGDTVWTRHYVVPGRENWDGLAYSITKTADGHYVVAGEIFFQSEYRSDVYALKIDDYGDTLWTTLIDYDLREYAWDCVETPEGDIVLTGWTWGGFSDTTGDEVYLAKLTQNGDLLWQKTYAYAWPVCSYNDGWAVAVDPVDHGYIIAADTRPQAISSRDVYILKTDSEGDTLWTTRVEDPADDSPFNITITSDNGFAVCGQKYVVNSHGFLYKDFYLLKFDLITGVLEPDSRLPEDVELIQNYPNPFNSATTIRFVLSRPRDIRISIYDILGRKVSTLVDGYIQPGNHNVTLDASELTSGIYFYRFETDNIVKKKRMLLLR